MCQKRIAIIANWFLIQFLNFWVPQWNKKLKLALPHQPPPQNAELLSDHDRKYKPLATSGSNNRIGSRTRNFPPSLFFSHLKSPEIFSFTLLQYHFHFICLLFLLKSYSALILTLSTELQPRCSRGTICLKLFFIVWLEKVGRVWVFQC